MISEKLKLYLLLVSFISASVIAGDKGEYEKEIQEIKASQALVEYEKKGIKNLIEQLKGIEEGTPQKKSLSKLLKQKHIELNIKIEELNQLIKATKYKTSQVSDKDVKKLQTLDEIEDEMGIDRVITASKKRVEEQYKDFIKSPENKAWQKKKKDYFRIEEQKQKIIFVE